MDTPNMQHGHDDVALRRHINQPELLELFAAQVSTARIDLPPLSKEEFHVATLWHCCHTRLHWHLGLSHRLRNQHPDVPASDQAWSKNSHQNGLPTSQIKYVASGPGNRLYCICMSMALKSLDTMLRSWVVVDLAFPSHLSKARGCLHLVLMNEGQT
ncbi:hypothetical protein AMTRI_Chr03g148970 [Amborella trichopoda]|uniref:uncharacterized protein LOC105420418 n=1 Tax=Amborella trichopoda TaxID=13333 RepID=UPI0005D30F2C|nr:uncharacterized protein LOC105420418 [Amborella trichopoda]|eukprot:XP_011622253.1 uncharacterized protein LOC105420418 [Amborella trichopoda]